MTARTIMFLAVRNVLRLVGLGPRPDANDVEIAVLRLWGSRTLIGP